MVTESKRELRLALGMRGGVSLAVWIGGACVEIDELRRAPSHQDQSQQDQQTDDQGFWTGLTTATGYNSVVVDVMAGASAGGLNGVLFAACQVYGVPFDSIRATWLEVGSTEKLVRTNDTEPDSEADLRWLSLFRGDRHMFAAIARALTTLIDDVEDQQRPTQPPRVDLRLSATHVEPVVRPVRSPADEPLSDRRFATGFRFCSPDQPWLTGDFPWYAPPSEPGRGAFLGHLNRLALAARTTSSFPGAFEAASVRSSRRSSFSAPEPDFSAPEADPISVEVDMAGIFADRTDDTSFVVADGGIVDNIPLRRALDAVAAAPATGPTDRYLVYLHPGIPTAPTVDTSGDTLSEQGRRSVVSVLKAAIGAKITGEDISGDIAAIDEYNQAVERAAAVRHATFGTLMNRDNLMSSSLAGRTSYLTQRADEDTRLITNLLDDPLGFLGDDPFPSRAGEQPVADSRWRSPLADYSLAQHDELADELYRYMASRLPSWHNSDTGLDGSVFGTGARPLVRTAQALLEWARYVEMHNPAEAGPVKEVLYRVLAFCEAGIERPRRMAWVALLATAPRDEDNMPPVSMAEVLETTISRLGILTNRSAEEAAALCDALIEGDNDQLSNQLQTCRAKVDGAVADVWDDGNPEEVSAEGIDLRREIVERVLVTLAERLRTSDVPENSGDEENQESRPPIPGKYLQRVFSGDDPVSVETLAALEVACYPEHATGTPGRRPIDFVRLSAANPTPLAPCFDALEADAKERGTWWDPDNQIWAEQRGVHVELKLAGNELGNFSAFLRDSWRANDWMWGRLDAVPTLVDLMVTPDAIRRGFSTPDERLEAIRRLIVDSTDGELGEIGSELWEKHGAQIGAELDAVSAGDDITTLECTRAALVERRQWEILSEELSGSGSVREQIRNYRVGAEQVTDPETRKEIRLRLREITDAASQMLLATTSAHGSKRYGTPDRPTWRGRGVRFVVGRGGRWASRRITKPARITKPRKTTR